MNEFDVPLDKLQELITQSDRDIADYIMAMDELMANEPAFMANEWRVRRELWMGKLSRG
jgi:hypothetical protein